MTQSKIINDPVCEEEAIQFLGKVQPYGVLFFLNIPDLEILQVSENTADWLGIDPQTLLGQPLSILFPQTELYNIQEALSNQNLVAANPFLLTYQDQQFDGIVHQQDGGIILEIEKKGHTSYSSHGFYQLLKPMIAKIKAVDKQVDFLSLVVQELRKLTGYDRVMIYQFFPDESGVVVAEDKKDHLESYLDLHYPATDIPTVARKLYYHNWLRIIGNVDNPAINIIPSDNPLTNAPLNLSFATLRSVSQIHIDYLKNMGVTATLCISLINEEKLWGMIVCHHYQPKWINYELRQACEFIGQFISLELFKKEQKELEKYKILVDDIKEKLQQNLDNEEQFIQAILNQEGQSLLTLFQATGIGILLNDHLTLLGETPSETEIKELVEWIQVFHAKDVFTTHCLSQDYPPASAYQKQASGLLSISIVVNQAAYYLLLFRPEIIQTVNWGGNPNEPFIEDEKSHQLSPRNSFELWKEIVRGTSCPWSKVEIEAAHSLRNTLMLAVLGFSQKALEISAKQAEAANKAKSEFLSNMSHEIRTPMNAILGFSDLLKETVHDSQTHTYLNSIIASGQTLIELINDILDLSKIEAGKLEIKFEPLSLKELVREIQDIFTPKATAKNLFLTLDIADAVPDKIIIDGIRLRQILFNLVGNAIKFTEKGGVTIHLNTDLSDNSQTIKLILSVKDTGIGIVEEQQNYIFNAFQQADGQSTRKYGGTGLGLTITKRLTEMLGGTITVKSQPHQGSCFTCTFDNIALTDEILLKYNSSETDNNLNQFLPMKILVADDAASNLEIIQAYFQGTHHNLYFAKNGEEAIQMINNQRFDLILLDLRMPIYDGYHVATYIRNNSFMKKVPIIILTASAFEHEIDPDYQHLWNGLLRKPVRRSQLVTLLKQILSTSISPNISPTISVKEMAKNQKGLPILKKAELMEKLENELQTIYPKLSQRMINREIKKFAYRLQQWSQDYQCSLLGNYAAELLTHLENFEDEKLTMTLSQFPDLITSLQA